MPKTFEEKFAEHTKVVRHPEKWHPSKAALESEGITTREVSETGGLSVNNVRQMLTGHKAPTARFRAAVEFLLESRGWSERRATALFAPRDGE